MPATETLNDLYTDTKTCARLVGLQYIQDESKGVTRTRHGKGFRYHDHQNKAVTAALKQRIVDLVIPPAWQEVWICPSDKGHVLATGIDEKGRKQYLYHPKWRTMRDVIKFYRMILFARSLPAIRKNIDRELKTSNLTRASVIATMLWILDNAYIRVGNSVYYEQNESIGLTTLTDENVIIAGSVVTLTFTGKSGKDQQITFDNARIAAILDKLRAVKGARLFRFQHEGHWQTLEASDINSYLHELTNNQISAKDFRTWGGTLMAFMHLIDEDESSKKKTEKVVLEAVDQAAAVLGNTRTVARSSYVHPHILALYSKHNFEQYYAKASNQRKVAGLDKRETELLYVLEELFETEFTLLRHAEP